MGHLLRSVIETVSAREGAPPDRVVLTHPANYGPYKLDMMREVARLGGCDLDRTTFITEPEAAALSYAARNRVEPGEIVAVYDFGGGTFDAALVQRTASGFSLIGRPEGMERFGGIDIDAAIVAHVDQSLGGQISALPADDAESQAAVSRLRDDCRSAKEALSGDTDTAISVSVPGLQTQIRLTRPELEDMIRPRLRETLEALQRAVRSAGLTIDKVSRVLLVGGSSRIPLVAETIARETGRPVAVDAHPKFAIALGAAGFGVDTKGAAPVIPPPPTARPAAPTSTPAPSAPRPPAPAASAPTAIAPTTAPAPPTAASAAPVAMPATAKKRKPVGLIVGAAAAVAALGIGGFALTRGAGSDSADTTERSRRTDPDETDETVPATVAPTVTVETTPPTEVTVTTTAGAGGPLTAEQLTSALITADELDPSWTPFPLEDPPSATVCGQLVPENEIGSDQVSFSRTVAGINQLLTNEVSTYADTATADQEFAAINAIIDSCPFDNITDASGAPLGTISYQRAETEPGSLCQSAEAIRVDSADAQGNLLSSQMIFLRVCANNATSVALEIPGTADVFPQALLDELDQVMLTSSLKLIALPSVP
jgi:actin-like ATPase involved in cell morphogenesis